MYAFMSVPASVRACLSESMHTWLHVSSMTSAAVY